MPADTQERFVRGAGKNPRKNKNFCIPRKDGNSPGIHRQLLAGEGKRQQTKEGKCLKATPRFLGSEGRSKHQA